MNKIHKIISATALLLFSLGNVQAALVNYTITGFVDADLGSIFGLSDGDSITATGTFDDSELTGDAGTVFFDSLSGYTMTIIVGTETYTASNDVGFNSAAGPSITFTSLSSISDFDFLSADNSFNSNGLFFDDLDSGTLFGEWTTVETTVVPVPAAVWLFGSGLLGLVGIARRKTA